MLDALYRLVGRRMVPTQEERDRAFAAMKRGIEAFEADMAAKKDEK